MTYDLKSGSQNIFEINNGINIAVCRDNLLVQELTGYTSMIALQGKPANALLMDYTVIYTMTYMMNCCIV